jgi:hypothetical protein
MIEAEILFPVTCPTCSQESHTGFRMSVVAEAFQTREIRLYAACHVVSWEASWAELEQIHDYLDAGWAWDLQEEARRQLDMESSAEIENLAFIHTVTGAQTRR